MLSIYAVKRYIYRPVRRMQYIGRIAIHQHPFVNNCRTKSPIATQYLSLSLCLSL